jgi:signal transduction histidine kinase
VTINVVRWVRSSLYVKILLIILLCYIAVTWASIETHRALFRRPHYERRMESFVNVCDHIVDEVGTPPDTVRAAELAAKLNVQMRIESGLFFWSMPADMPPLDDERLSPYRETGVRVGFDRGRQVEIVRDGVRYRFHLQGWGEIMPHAAELELALHILYTTIMLVLIYVGIRWQQRPLGVLHRAVRRVAGGDLDFEIDSRRHDEMGLLVRSFNAMRAAIVEMIRARDQLLLDVSHEFRSPLTRMKVSLEMMEESEERDNLISDVGELETMVTEILEGARIQSQHGALELRESDIRTLLEGICREFTDRAPGVRFTAQPRRALIIVDAARVRLLFRNVIANAVKYSRVDGKPVDVSLAETPDEFTVTVRDHGCGIPEKELPFIFEPFYRVDKSRSKGTGGYGLGMHLSKKIMDAHSGEIGIESREGEGTTVTLRFRK